MLDALAPLERAGRPARIPVDIVETKHGLRLDLLLGRTLRAGGKVPSAGTAPAQPHGSAYQLPAPVESVSSSSSFT